MEETNYTEVLLGEDGRVFRRVVQQREVVVDENAVFSAVKESQMARIPNAMIVGKSIAGLSIKEEPSRVIIYATVSLPFVRFNTSFKTLEDGQVVVPVFEKPNPSSSTPRFTVDWDVAVACQGKVRLWLLVEVIKTKEPLFETSTCWLAATSSSGHIYRIPLSNVYDDCKICMGDTWGGRQQPTLQQSLDEALNQFLNSPWNSDLSKSREKSDAFFRFKPENEGFKTLPTTQQWNNLCERVSYPALDVLCIPGVTKDDKEVEF
jgi:hypothetical protein